MKKQQFFLVGVMVAAVAIIGCDNSEARRFGYCGADLENNQQLYFTTGGSVTNYVPARVLEIDEQYEFSEEESKVLLAIGAIHPGEELASIPEGYVEKSREPWLTVFTREHKALGFDGTLGFIAHQDDTGTWHTGQAYFSSYWPSQATAIAALQRLRAKFETELNPKRFHDFDGCFIAEYRRLRVLAIVGRLADGKWSCMLDLRDKGQVGCGDYVPVEEQQERLNDYRYAKAMNKWREQASEVLARNHDEIEDRLRAQNRIVNFGSDWSSQDVDRRCYFKSGELAAGEDAKARFMRLCEELERKLMVSCQGEISSEVGDEGYEYLSRVLTNDFYEVQLDMACPPVGGNVEGEMARSRRGHYRIVVGECLLKGNELPALPKYGE